MAPPDWEVISLEAIYLLLKLDIKRGKKKEQTSSSCSFFPHIFVNSRQKNVFG